MTTTIDATATPRDPYARAAELDEQSVITLAARFETRAADPRQQRLWQDALARAPHVPHARLLEVGCGTGIITALLADLPDVAEVTGCDPAAGFVDRARRRAPHLRFEVADGRSLPFATSSFDGVVFATTLCHIPAPELALAEARRVLRPGGYLLVYDGDYATTTVALSANDPLQACVRAAIDALVHDRWLIRRLHTLVASVGFTPGDMHTHGHLELTSPAYLTSMIDFGADTLRTAGALDADTCAALKAEARRRADEGRFFGHIAYASLLAYA